MFFLTSQMVDIVENMISSDFLSSNSPQAYQRCIQGARFVLQHPNILNTIEDNNGEQTGSRTLDISRYDNGTLFAAWIKEVSLLHSVVSRFVRDPKERSPFHAPPSYKSNRDYLRELHGLYQERDRTVSPSFCTLLRTAPSANETKTTCMEKKVF